MIRWTTDPLTEHGTVDRGFELDVAATEVGPHVVPGVLLTPEEHDAPLPLILIGHGATLHKRHTAPYSVARRLARRDNVAVALLDQPGHGDRPPEEAQLPHPARHALALAGWTATLDAMSELPEVDAARVGYWGLSLGTDYGLPFVATDQRVRVAVLGLYGVGANTPGDPDALGYAARLRSPVLWVMQWDDELFDRAGQLALFDAVASEDKRMLVYPGGHEDTPDEGLRIAREFLVRELTR